MTRQSWDSYFMSIAETVSTRSTCDRLHTGTVIVRDRTILATGYNGSLPKTDHCDDVGHLLRDNHCVRTVHAEANAIAQAAKNGISLHDTTCYTVAVPCWKCFQLLISAGIKTIKYRQEYGIDALVVETAEKLGIALEKI